MAVSSKNAQGGNGVASQGFPWLRVAVESVEDGLAVCRDQFGKYRRIRTDYRRGGGSPPRAGEEWMIDRTLGYWTFSTIILANPPHVTGDRSDGTALANLLTVLENLGLIVDDTTA